MSVERLVPGSHDWNKYYVEHIDRYSYFEDYYKGKKVLDLACGVGYGSHFISMSGCSEIIGVDISQEAVNYAKSNYVKDNLSFVLADYKNLSEYEGYFDLIVSFETIEHVENPDHFLEFTSNLLKPTGQIICSSPNKQRFSGSGINNPFHFSEMYFDEFEKLMGKFFKIKNKFHQSESIPYFRYLEQGRNIQHLKNIIKSNKILKLENFVRKLFNKEVLLEPRLTPDLTFLYPGDYIIEEIDKNPEPFQKTFIFIGEKQ